MAKMLHIFNTRLLRYVIRCCIHPALVMKELKRLREPNLETSSIPRSVGSAAPLVAELRQATKGWKLNSKSRFSERNERSWRRISQTRKRVDPRSAVAPTRRRQSQTNTLTADFNLTRSQFLPSLSLDERFAEQWKTFMAAELSLPPPSLPLYLSVCALRSRSTSNYTRQLVPAMQRTSRIFSSPSKKSQTHFLRDYRHRHALAVRIYSPGSPPFLAPFSFVRDEGTRIFHRVTGRRDTNHHAPLPHEAVINQSYVETRKSFYPRRWPCKFVSLCSRKGGQRRQPASRSTPGRIRTEQARWISMRSIG